MEGSVYTNVFLQPLMKTRCSACPWPNCGCHSSWWHTVNSLSPQSTFHSATINSHLTEKIYNCQEPSSLLKVFQGHRYHINRGWGGQEEVGGITWEVSFCFASSPFPSPVQWVLLSSPLSVYGFFIPHSGLLWSPTNTYGYPLRYPSTLPSWS